MKTKGLSSRHVSFSKKRKMIFFSKFFSGLCVNQFSISVRNIIFESYTRRKRRRMHCTALHCTALHCTALHCTALDCTGLQCTALHRTVLCCTALDWTARNWTVKYGTVLYSHVMNCLCLLPFCRISLQILSRRTKTKHWSDCVLPCLSDFL